MPIKLQRKGKFFVRFLISYILILIIPMGIGLHAYYQTINMLREEASQLNYVVLEHTEGNLAKLLSEIRGIVTQLSLDAELLQLMLTADASWSPQTIYNFAEERKQLKKLSTNEYFSMLYVYLEKSETILSTNMIERVDRHPLHVGEQPLGQWIEESLRSERVNHYQRIERVTDGKTIGNYIAYVSPLPSGSGTGAGGALVVLIDEKSIIQLLSPLLKDRGAFTYIADRDRSLIASASQNGLAHDLIALPHDSKEDYFIREVDGQKMLITRKLNADNEWTFVAGLPIDVVFSKADYIKRINWTIAVAALALGGIIVLLLAYRNSKPLKELLESIMEFAGSDTSKRSSEMEMLRNIVHQIVSYNKSLNVRMNTQIPIMQAACLELLLNSGFRHERDWRKHIEAAQIRLIDDNIVVAIIKIFDGDVIHREEEEPGTDRKQLVADSLKRISGPGCYIHEVKSGELAFIYSFAGEESDNKLSELAEELRLVQENLLRQASIMTSIAIGQVYHSAMDLWRSYNEAVQTLEVQDPDTPQQLWRFDAGNQNANQYYYPLDLELKLMNMVRVGDPSGLERLFEHIENQNFQVRKLNPRSKKLLLQEMQGSLQKLTEQVSHLSVQVDLEPELDPPHGVQPDTLDSAYAQLKAVFFAICDEMRNQNSSKQKIIVEGIKAYLANNFSDSNVSLCQLAGEYKLTESFLSVYFKDQTGQTFSEYLEKLRLDEACRLLKSSSSPIQDIAVQVGYNSDKSFRRAFKRVYGIQPTYYRKTIEIEA